MTPRFPTVRNRDSNNLKLNAFPSHFYTVSAPHTTWVSNFPLSSGSGQ